MTHISRPCLRLFVALALVLAAAACSNEAKDESPSTTESTESDKAAAVEKTAPVEGGEPDEKTEEPAADKETDKPDEGAAKTPEAAPDEKAEAPEKDDTPPAAIEQKAEPAKDHNAADSDGVLRFDLPEDEKFGVLEMAIASGLENRDPTGASNTFPLSTGRLVFWMNVRNTTPAERTLKSVWIKGDKEVFSFDLKVGVSKGWRTWSYKRLRKKDAGPWKVEVRDERNQTLQSISFVATEG